MASGGSNLGPSNQDLLNTVSQRVAAYRKLNGLAADAKVPVDAVTASGSGLDPAISVANARLQAARVANARGMTVDQVDQAK
jgi:K+-transporting ATPase ATPase C chain